VSGIAGWAESVMESLGALGVGLLIALETLFPPLPSELVLPLAGFTASRGELGLVPVVVMATAGSLAGALVLYGLGRRLGHDRVRRLVGRLPLVEVEDLDRAAGWFARHGAKAVLFGRMVPVVRSLVSVPAGVERMPLPRFCFYTALGSAVWNSSFVLAGYLLREKWHDAERFADWVGWGVLVVGAVWLVRFVVTRLRGGSSSSGSSDGDPEEGSRGPADTSV
jgi:membrane protein DedA with SNARE-associated domain